MAEYGFVGGGYVAKPSAVVLEESQARLRALYPAAQLDAKTYVGSQIAIIADIAGALRDEIAEAVAAADPDQAEDGALEVICSYQLVTRAGATKSQVIITCTGVPATPIPDDADVAVPDVDVIFRIPIGGALVAVAAWAATTAVLLGDRRHKDGIVYECTVPGTTGASGPSGLGLDIADGATVRWRSLGTGTAVADLEAFCTETGPTQAAAGTITQIDTPTLGWESAVNLEDAVPGTDVQKDESLRISREVGLTSGATTTPDGIRSAILKVLNVKSATVFYNKTALVDADGVPGHSVELLVTGGDDQEIAEVLYRSVTAGDGFHGAILRTVLDSEGQPHDVRFSRPTEVPIYVTITIRRDPLRFDAIAGPTAVNQLLTGYGDAQETGTDVDAFAVAAQVSPRISAADSTLVQEAVPGLVSVASCAVGTAPAPVGLTVAITRRQRADLDSSRITIVQGPPA